MLTLVLASSSPRRLALLEQIGVKPARIAAPAIDETPLKTELPHHYALRVAQAKARAVARQPNEIVLAGDTTVAVGRRILPPAETPEIAARLLELLSGRRHQVLSAIAVIDAQGRLRTRLVRSTVIFKRFERSEIESYVASGEGIGKAGGYAIQGCAAGFVRHLSGSYSGVVGLPLYETRLLLRASGLDAA